ncbi:metallo-beta-lactamase superfamily protein [Ferroplasma acidiphilum]|uniref:Metallo-beta-lactamase superfamily protein n=1 Tax=Ferroplasma acidiphilum TaxID=74969 RepID=A0A1V0N450_9ARCH|nr:N-acyl homoserine lactonase family protein [Ferroplasma acidiphilum]ARD84866.1 metallo-beta-lactamase superfamily protein [Ferroplasma acidiphilum]
MYAEKIYLLDYGWLGGDCGWFLPGAAGGAMTYSNRNPEKKWIEIPVSGALIQHKDGYILFDTGISPEAMKTHEKGLMEAFPITRISDENKLENQLKKINVKPADISFVVISHLHLDHIGQAGIFKDLKTPIIVQKTELESALSLLWQGKGGAYDISDLDPLRNANWFPINDEKFEIMDGVEAEFTGGHTRGHQVLNVKTKNKKYIFTGDYLHLPEEYNTESKGWLLSNANEWQDYMGKLKLKGKTGTNMVIGHDPDLWNKYPRAPNYLE